MRIAILSGLDFHVIGGAERFTIDLAKALDADIVVTNYNEDIVKIYDKNRDIKFISLNKKLPPPPLYQLYGMYLFKTLKLNYDFYVVTDDISAQFIKKDTPHIYYMLTPRRAIYDMRDEFLSTKKFPINILYSICLNIASIYDRWFVKNYIKNIVCISHNVKNRIQKIYNRDSDVIYPSIHIENYKNLKSEGYWLSVNRVDKWKRVELQIAAFRQIPDKNLIIVGKISPEFNSVVINAPDNVIFKSNVNEEELSDLYSKCEGFITTAINEDFGITPLEAMASGKPVIATKEGGYLEIIIDESTGILVEPSVYDIVETINTISKNPEIYSAYCIRQANKFDYENFKENINSIIKDNYK